MASSLDGFMDIVVVADQVVRQGTLRRKVMPSLLSRLGALGLWLVRAIIGGVATTSSYQWGMSIEVIPVGVGVVWDGWESAMWRREAKLSACCLRMMRKSRFASFNLLLVFGSTMSEMSSRQ
jgi:hypothetical protein